MSTKDSRAAFDRASMSDILPTYLSCYIFELIS